MISKKDIELQRDGLLIVQKLLKHAIEVADLRANRKKQKREQRIKKMTSFQNVEEAREAWGWGNISENEFKQIQSILEEGEHILETELSPEEIASRRLHTIADSLKIEINELTHSIEA